MSELQLEPLAPHPSQHHHHVTLSSFIMHVIATPKKMSNDDFHSQIKQKQNITQSFQNILTADEHIQ